MRAASLCGLVASGALVAPHVLGFQDSNVLETLTRSRQAVGADAVAHLQSLVFTGLSRIPANQGLMECELEIRVLLPDRYLRIDRASFGERRAGFQGTDVLNAISEHGRTTLPPDSLKKQILQAERERMVQLLLGAVAYVPLRDGVLFKPVPGTLKTEQAQAGAEAAAQRAAAVQAWEAAGREGQPPPGRSGVESYASNSPDPYSFLVSVREGAWFRFTTEPQTFMPARLSYVTANGDDVTVAFGERRLTDGLKAPYRITTTSRGHIIDDLLIDHVAVNSRLTTADFAR